MRPSQFGRRQGFRKPEERPGQELYGIADAEEVDRMLAVMRGYDFHYKRSQEQNNLGVFRWQERNTPPQARLEELRRVTRPEVAEIISSLSSRSPELADAFVGECVQSPTSLESLLEVRRGIAEGGLRPAGEVIGGLLGERRNVCFLVNPGTGLVLADAMTVGHETLAANSGIHIGEGGVASDEYRRYLKGNISFTRGVQEPTLVILLHQFHQSAETERWEFRRLAGYACQHLVLGGVQPEIRTQFGLHKTPAEVTLGEVAEGGSTKVEYYTESDLQRVKEIELRAAETAAKPVEKIVHRREAYDGLTVRMSDLERFNGCYILQTDKGYVLTTSRDEADDATLRGDNVLGINVEHEQGPIIRVKFKHTLHIQNPGAYTIVRDT